MFAWSLGYDHFHLLIQPGDEFSISDVMHCLKRNVSRNINRIILYSAGEDSYPRRYRNLIHQIIGEHMNARLLEWGIDYKQYCLKKCYKFKWQRGFNDQIINGDDDFDAYWEYIKWNPIKHNMPDGWPYVFDNPKYGDLIDYIDF